MNATATHQLAPLAAAAERSEPAPKPTPSPATLVVWEAEDGRCEACDRPMDKTCGRTGRDKRGDRRLVCPDCKERRPDRLEDGAVVGPKTAGYLAEALGMTPEEASAWLKAGLRTSGVLLRLQDDSRVYWLPGVGHFPLFLERAPDRPPLIGGPLHRELEIRIKPPARTRGLPRLRAPGTAPAQQTGEHP